MELMSSAVTPDEAAGPFADFVENLTMEMTGKMWAPSTSPNLFVTGCTDAGRVL